MSKRPSSAFMEARLFEPAQIHAHGEIVLMDYMGTDDCVVEAARTSYQSGTKAKRGAQGLLNYLMRKDHTTPFEMCEIKIRVKLPIFVAAQWIRQRTASTNQESARYSIIKDEFFFPELKDITYQDPVNKQGRTNERNPKAAVIQQLMVDRGYEAFTDYNEMLEYGCPRELARTVLPQSTYTTMVWKIDLHNLLKFLGARTDPHAQKEIRDYADILWSMVEGWVPLTASAFKRYKKESFTLCSETLAYLRNHVRIEADTPPPPLLTETEWKELQAALAT